MFYVEIAIQNELILLNERRGSNDRVKENDNSPGINGAENAA